MERITHSCGFTNATIEFSNGSKCDAMQCDAMQCNAMQCDTPVYTIRARSLGVLRAQQSHLSMHSLSTKARALATTPSSSISSNRNPLSKGIPCSETAKQASNDKALLCFSTTYQAQQRASSMAFIVQTRRRRRRHRNQRERHVQAPSQSRNNRIDTAACNSAVLCHASGLFTLQ